MAPHGHVGRHLHARRRAPCRAPARPADGAGRMRSAMPPNPARGRRRRSDCGTEHGRFADHRCRNRPTNPSDSDDGASKATPSTRLKGTIRANRRNRTTVASTSMTTSEQSESPEQTQACRDLPLIDSTTERYRKSLYAFAWKTVLARSQESIRLPRFHTMESLPPLPSNQIAESAIDTPSRAPTARHRQTSTTQSTTAARRQSKTPPPARGSAVRIAGAPPRARPAPPDPGRSRSSSAGPRPWRRRRRRDRTAPATATHRARARPAPAPARRRGDQLGEPGQPVADARVGRPRSAQLARGNQIRGRQGVQPGQCLQRRPRPDRASTTRARPPPAARQPGSGPSPSRQSGSRPAAHRPARPRHAPPGSTPRRPFSASLSGLPDDGATR